MGTTQGTNNDNDPPAQKQRNKFPKGNKIGNRFSSTNQPKVYRRPRKVVKLLEQVTEVPRQEISNVIKSIFFDRTVAELKAIIADNNQKAFIQICAKVALNCKEEGKTSDFETLLGWAYVKKQEMRVELDDVSKMTREEKEAEALRLLEESGVEVESE